MSILNIFYFFFLSFPSSLHRAQMSNTGVEVSLAEHLAMTLMNDVHFVNKVTGFFRQNSIQSSQDFLQNGYQFNASFSVRISPNGRGEVYFNPFHRHWGFPCTFSLPELPENVLLILSAIFLEESTQIRFDVRTRYAIYGSFRGHEHFGEILLSGFFGEKEINP